MNTGMQDAFNLAWKLALVEREHAKDSLLDSYSAERGAVAKQILSDSGRMTRIAMAHNPLAQHLRNFIAHHLLGLPIVEHAVADRLSEITIGYPDSPLNAGSVSNVGGLAPGQRIVADSPFGAGNSPRFALLAAGSDAARNTLRRYASLLETDLRPPDGDAIRLVRPDGYIAAVAKRDDWRAIEDALNKIA